ncbi:MAG: acetate uptake transporter [Desulfurococcales archaeon]|nr:acetate uptake transporter [Desulfurococcales archaeon]
MAGNGEWGNPAALGLAGFGLTTTALSLHNLGVIPTASYTLAYGFMYGGLAQVIAGIIDFRRNNVFGGTAFTSYGLFWLGLSLLTVLEATGIYPEVSPGEFATWMVLWGIFTLYMAVGAYALKARAVTVVLTLLTILFFILAAAQYSETVLKIAGAWGVLTGLSAVYTSAAIIVNTTMGKEVLPE